MIILAVLIDYRKGINVDSKWGRHEKEKLSEKLSDY